MFLLLLINKMSLQIFANDIACAFDKKKMKITELSIIRYLPNFTLTFFQLFNVRQSKKVWNMSENIWNYCENVRLCQKDVWHCWSLSENIWNYQKKLRKVEMLFIQNMRVTSLPDFNHNFFQLFLLIIN